jgi:cytochrome bd-type quinol oxidase subunit 2
MAEYPQSDTATESQIKSKARFREKAGEELREFIVLTAYLYICFAAVIYFKAAVLQAHDVAYAHMGLAIVKAAICAKFMLMGRVFHMGERFEKLPLIVPTLHRSFIFLLLLAVLTFIEEIVVGTIHGRTVPDSISGIAGGTLQQMVATILIIFLILVPYFAFRSLGEIVGDKTLVRLFFERRHRA